MKIAGHEIVSEVVGAELQTSARFIPSQLTLTSIITEKLPKAKFYLTANSDLIVVDRGIFNFVSSANIRSSVIRELSEDDTKPRPPRKPLAA